jgi:ATP-dependent DNA ligase
MNEAAFHLTEQSTLREFQKRFLRLEPMKAVLVEKAFSHAEWLFETKWDGVRAVCFIEDGVGRLMSRNQLDITARYPELELLAEWVNASQAVIDGEIVSLDEEGLPSFSASSSPARARTAERNCRQRTPEGRQLEMSRLTDDVRVVADLKRSPRS